MKALAIAALALLASCSQTGDIKTSVDPAPEAPAAVEAPINDLCPVSGRQASAETTASHDGHAVAFCCGNCKGQFAGWPAAKKSEFVTATLASKKDAINSTCPISKRPVDGSTASTHGGHRVAFCCGNCQAKFAGWSDEQKNGYIKTALAAQGGASAAAPAKKAAWAGDPYLLTTCAVSGEELDPMEEAITHTVDGRQLKVCCKRCAAKLDADATKFLVAVDRATAANQAAVYPTTRCLVSGEELEGEPVDVVVGNRLFRVCCKRCAGKVKADPGAFAEKLDAMVVEVQAKDYPVGTCLVRGKKLSPGAKQVVVGNRLVQLCCSGCVKKFNADPAKYVAQIDRAWAAKKKN